MPFVGLGVGVGRQRFGVGGGGGFVGLLDTYSGAAAAYSLRQLSSTYSGDAIRVRRASDNTEQDIGFVNNVLDTSTLTSFCSGTNGFVKTWYDQSGNGNDATQTTAANQPQIVSSGSVILDNGKPTFLFDGVDDKLTFTDLSFNPTYTHAVVLNCTTTSTNERCVLVGIQNGISTLKYQTNTSNYIARYVSPTTDYLIDTTLSQELVFVYRNSIEIRAALNSTLASAATYYNNSVAIKNIGDDDSGGNAFSGNIQEVIIYTSDESTNRTGIETNINSYYSIY